MKKINTAKICLSALFCAIISIFSQISVMTPLGVPFSLQTFAVTLCGCMLGSAYGTASVFIYIILGAVGLPIFTLFRGGAQILFGITGGFIWGFLPLAFLSGLSVKIKSKTAKFAVLLSGIVFCHLIGVLQFKFVSSNSFLSAFIAASLPYLLKDTVCAMLAYYTAQQIRKKSKGLF